MINQAEKYFKGSSVIKRLIKYKEKEISEIEKEASIPSGYLATYLALHIPKYKYSDLFLTNNINTSLLDKEILFLKKSLCENLKHLPRDLMDMVYIQKCDSKVKISNGNIYEKLPTGELEEIRVGLVEEEVGILYQKRLHYLKQPRFDNLFHIGLYRQKDKYPFAFASYSVLDREYILNALPEGIEMKEVLVLTRSYNINSSPLNSMSLLFGQANRFIKESFKGKYKYIVTAVNPNTLFNGTVFKGSAFFVFALAPFIPHYSDGLYVSRKQISRKKIEEYTTIEDSSNLDLSPTVLMGHGLDSDGYFIMRDAKVRAISKSSYLFG